MDYYISYDLVLFVMFAMKLLFHRQRTEKKKQAKPSGSEKKILELSFYTRDHTCKIEYFHNVRDLGNICFNIVFTVSQYQ